jgi:hypothetical protein
MSKTITIKLTKAGPTAGPFTISDQFGNIIAQDVSKKTLIAGISYIVNNNVTMLIIKSLGSCKAEKVINLAPITLEQYVNVKFSQTTTACIWRHLTNIRLYNTFYGNIAPYIIEYPFAYQYQDEILQNVKDYTKAYEYYPIENDGVFNDNTRIETNDKWFNQAIVYNSQQNSGLLNLVAKPLNNLKAYNSYPIYNTDSKTIMYTKSDNFYQYNTFWNVQINSQLPAFKTTCESLSVDKILNQSNMDYGMLSFKKTTIRAKDLRIRHILNNSSTTHLVSQFITTGSQISYK